MRKRVLSLCIVLALCLSFLPVPIKAEEMEDITQNAEQQDGAREIGVFQAGVTLPSDSASEDAVMVSASDVSKMMETPFGQIYTLYVVDSSDEAVTLRKDLYRDGRRIETYVDDFLIDGADVFYSAINCLMRYDMVSDEITQIATGVHLYDLQIVQGYLCGIDALNGMAQLYAVSLDSHQLIPTNYTGVNSYRYENGQLYVEMVVQPEVYAQEGSQQIEVSPSVATQRADEVESFEDGLENIMLQGEIVNEESDFDFLSATVTLLSIQPAILDLPRLYVTQGANGSYSHTSRNAFDIDASYSGRADIKAPFDGTVRFIASQEHAIWFESNDVVQYANGTVSKLTVLTMHDNDVSDLDSGKTFRQGEVYTQEGDYGNATGIHMHIECINGGAGSSAWSQRGNVLPNDALYLSSTTKIDYKGKDSDGKLTEWRIWDGSFPVDGQSTLHIEDPVYPTGTLEPGQGFGLRGIIRSNYTLTNVSAKVEDASGNTVMWYSANPGGYSYDIRTGFNNEFIFNNLSVGHYRYVVSASDSSPISKTLIDSEFDVGTHTHQKGAYQWYEDTHPHYHYWKCSICGELFTDGSTAYVDTCSDCVEHTHQKGAYQWYEDAHPHYHYWKCSICGELFTDGSTAHVDTCPDCVEPGKPSLTGMKSVYASGEAIILRWGDTVNTTHINLYFDKKNGAGEYERVYTVHYAENGLSETFDAGEYRVLIQSTNSNSWLPDGSTWRYTNGDWVSFTVNPPVPSNPQMSVNKESIVAGEEITFTYGATDATSYYIGIDRDGSRILSQNVPTSGFTTSFLEPGQYSAYVSCSNAAGFVDSNRVSFAVNLPEYYLDVNGYLDGAASGSLGDYGTVDVWINGSLEANDVSDYYTRWPAGTSYEIRDIKPKAGYSYNGVHEGIRSGTLSSTHAITLDFTTISDIEENPERMSFNGHTYLAFNTPVTWYAAKKICENRGGHLATISSAEENAFVRSIITGEFWIGGTDTDDEQHWRWVTGEAFSYENWRSGQPDNSASYEVSSTHTGEENHLRVYENGEWNDISGCLQYPFVCEIDSASNAPQIAISDRTAAPGSSIRVPVLLKDNPGLVSFRFKVAYDASKLELTGVDNADYNLVAAQNLNSPVVFNFTDATGGDRTDAGAGVLNFQVKDGASGEAAFSVVIDDPDDFYNAAGQPVAFSAVAGKVAIREYTPGDVNGDGKVNNRDVGRLQQFLSDWDVTIVRAASDTNGDGKVNNRDVGRLQQFLSDWDVTLCGGTETEAQSGGARLQSAGSLTIAIDGRTATPGETIQVPVLLKDNPGLVSFRFKVSYDSSKLELTGRDDADYALVALKDLNSPVIFNFTDATGGDKRAVNAGVLNFKVKDGASGDAEFSVTVDDPDDFYNTSEDAIGVEISAGAIRITSDSEVSASIEGVQRNADNAVTASVVCSDRTAVVFCAVYNSAGKMIAVESKQVTESDSYDFRFGNAQFDYAKVFVLDSNFMPLCVSAKT